MIPYTQTIGKIVSLCRLTTVEYYHDLLFETFLLPFTFRQQPTQWKSNRVRVGCQIQSRRDFVSTLLPKIDW